MLMLLFMSTDKSFWIFLAGSVAKCDLHSAFIAEVKRSLPPEKSAELFQFIHCYKETDDYDRLVDVAALFNGNFNLLVSKLNSPCLHLFNIAK